MIIVILMGGLPSDFEKVVDEAMVALPGAVERLSLSGIQDPLQLDRIQKSLLDKNGVVGDDRVTIITGISTERCVRFWREHGGIFCHVRGPLHPVFYTQRIEFEDYHVAPLGYSLSKPEHVLDPVELISEVLLKRQ
ncbi:hypothetical protein [Pseudoalteromonas sp. Of7M-16]|uniref:hypothetical protein n=1 Tax=Pseudoalteromonas sp. Of7M-16 TaxID=2917756 RepID=UPI001EF67BA7|nr:hypothetical protein [Pseudoalteromonas sp. Of7M-16]MCG7551602.1 hypothetical protein [Pseudoalteromonas sp. Of7M-16]